VDKITWHKPDFAEEAAEYFENPHTRKQFAKRGLRFNDKQEFIDFLEANGRLTQVTERELEKRPENMTLDAEEFAEELSDPEYAESYWSLEYALANGKANFPAPIVFDFGDAYYLLSGNRRLNLAFNNNESLIAWMVAAK
jgi:hypothetical protein